MLRDDVLDTEVGLTEWSLLALKAMTGAGEANKTARACSRELLARLKHLQLSDRSGLYSSKTKASPSGELACTSFVGSVLAELFSSPADDLKLQWYHQLPVAAGTVDIIATACSAGESYPVVVIEFGWKRMDKRAQCLAYGANLSSTLLGLQTPLLAIMWNMDKQNPWNAQIELQVLGFHPHYARQSRMSAIVAWLGESSEQNVAKLLSTVSLFGQRIRQSQMSTTSISTWRYPSRTVAIEMPRAGPTMVYKLYDYRADLYGSPTFQRRHKQMVRFGENVVFELGHEGSDLVVLRYPYIDGEHVAASVKHFVSAIDSIAQLHQQQVVHGDIRASNLVFGEDGCCKLIDFDFAGSTSDTYPQRYIHDQNLLCDVVRHEGAQAERLLCFEHDWSALASIMEMHSCEGASLAWKQAIELLRKGDILSTLERLRQHSSLPLLPTEGLKHAVRLQKGTGTPEKPGPPASHRSGPSTGMKRPRDDARNSQEPDQARKRL